MVRGRRGSHPTETAPSGCPAANGSPAGKQGRTDVEEGSARARARCPWHSEGAGAGAELRLQGWRLISQRSQEPRGPCTWPLLSTQLQCIHTGEPGSPAAAPKGQSDDIGSFSAPCWI